MIKLVQVGKDKSVLKMGFTGNALRPKLIQ